MTESASIKKDPNREHPIPSVWRQTLTSIVEAIKDGDYEISRSIPNVVKVDQETANRISANISEYGVHLVSLPSETWDSSVCQWMETYWDLLVDLYSLEEGASDLVLAVHVFESEEDYIFKVHLVYVP